MKNIFKCLYQAAYNTIHDDGVEHAGYMAFLFLLSLFPSLVFLMAITGVVGASDIGTHFITLLLDNLPFNVTNAIQPRIQEILSGPPQGIVSLALIGVLWTSSSSVEGLRTILNRVYRVTTPPPYIFRRLLSILQFLIVIIVTIITTLILVIFPILLHKLSTLIIIDTHFANMVEVITNLISSLQYIRYIILYITLFIIVYSLYFMIPNTKLTSIYIAPGSILVVILWVIGGNIFTAYLKHFKQVSLVYGSLGGIIISLLFFYIVNLIFIYGAEFNYVFGQTMKKVHSRE
ncbi:MAG: YihY/virulence factor BrkB family protein [Rickettsiales endosymbiont of Dermacentor nuttalli]